MKRIIIAFLIILLSAQAAHAAKADRRAPDQLFYTANNDYEKRDYQKAIDKYLEILEMGLESGNLYYNIGNSYFKLGKTGYAILYYEKARRLMPQDSDLKSNLAYARSLVGETEPPDSYRLMLSRLARRPFNNMNLNGVAASTLAIYIVVVVLLVLFILNPPLGRKLRVIFWLVFVVFLLSLLVFGLRMRYEELMRHGIVLRTAVECKYEPIDASTTYFTLQEGSRVTILKTRNGWTQIRTPDGKIAWVMKDSVGEI